MQVRDLCREIAHMTVGAWILENGPKDLGRVEVIGATDDHFNPQRLCAGFDNCDVLRVAVFIDKERGCFGLCHALRHRHGFGRGAQGIGRTGRGFGQPVELFLEQAHQMIRVTHRPAGPGLDGIDPSADPVETQLEPPCAALGAGEPVAQSFGEVAHGGRDIFLAAQRLGKGGAQPPDRGRGAGGNRLIDLAQGLIQPPRGQFPEAARQPGAG